MLAWLVVVLPLQVYPQRQLCHIASSAEGAAVGTHAFGSMLTPEREPIQQVLEKRRIFFCS
jgi:hypothetical protein